MTLIGPLLFVWLYGASSNFMDRHHLSNNLRGTWWEGHSSPGRAISLETMPVNLMN